MFSNYFFAAATFRDQSTSDQIQHRRLQRISSSRRSTILTENFFCTSYLEAVHAYNSNRKEERLIRLFATTTKHTAKKARQCRPPCSWFPTTLFTNSGYKKAEINRHNYVVINLSYFLRNICTPLPKYCFLHRCILAASENFPGGDHPIVHPKMPKHQVKHFILTEGLPWAVRNRRGILEKRAR